jgi:dienelactone hydrolase
MSRWSFVRRGYGRSGGEPEGRGGGCGGYGSFKQAAEVGVDDLKAAARYAATLPEVDAATVISTGISSGGLAQVALAPSRRLNETGRARSGGS